MSLSLFDRRVVICWCVAVASPALVVADSLNPQGGQSQVAGSLPGAQVNPQVAIGANGGYLVWQDNGLPVGQRIKAVRLDPNLNASGAPILVSSASNSRTAGEQEGPQVTLTTNGAVVVWQGGRQGAQQIWARFLDNSGAVLRRDVRINTGRRSVAITPAVAALADGSLVCVWASSGQDGSRLGVYGQRFTTAGARLGREFRVNQWTNNNQRAPAVAALPTGGFVVAWVSELQRAFSSVDVYARLYDGAGNPLIDEFPVNTTTSNACANPCVTASSSGFAVVWSQNANVMLAAGAKIGVPGDGVSTTRSTNGWDVFAGAFDSSGSAVAMPFRLNTYTFGDQYIPRVAASGGDYLAVWNSLRQDGSWEGVFGQAFAGDGTLIGAELPVNTVTLSRQIQPAVAGDGVNRFVVIWSSFVVGGSFDFDLFSRSYLLSTGP